VSNVLPLFLLGSSANQFMRILLPDVLLYVLDGLHESYFLLVT